MTITEQLDWVEYWASGAEQLTSEQLREATRHIVQWASGDPERRTAVVDILQTV